MEQAVTFVENEEDRARHQVLLEDISKTERVTNVTILQTSVISPDNPSSPDEQGRWRTGLVRVRVEGYTLPAQIVQLDETSQDWYRTSKGWFIDIDD
jgi:hypothetical protein